MSERDDARRTIREALKYLRNYIKGFDCDYVDECYPGDPDACHTCKAVYQAEIAIAALDKLAVEPSEDARELVMSWAREHFVTMPDEESLIDLMKDIAARDERIRAEALREAAERMCVACTKKTTGKMCADEIKARCPSRAAILAPKEAHDERTE